MPPPRTRRPAMCSNMRRSALARLWPACPGGTLPLSSQKVLGDQYDLEPHGVFGELEEGKVAKPGILAGPDAVLRPGVATMACLHVGEVVVGESVRKTW